MKVIANFAMTVDGKVTTRTGSPTTFTSATDKRRLREIRALGDAVLVGASTVKADSMTMGLSDQDLRKKRLAEGRPEEPLRIIVSNSGRVKKDWKVFTNDRTRLLLFGPVAARFPSGLPPFCSVVRLNCSPLSLREVLQTLEAEHGCRTVVCEGGPRVFGALIADDLVDQLYLTIVPAVFGGKKALTLTGPAGGLPQLGPAFRIRSHEQSGEEVFLELVRRRPRN
ncbi:MAG: RibD family protein [Terrimicrobiaceae bacterium]